MTHTAAKAKPQKHLIPPRDITGRQILMQRTAHVQRMRNVWIQEAEEKEDFILSDIFRLSDINGLIIYSYTLETGQAEFKTLKDWNAEGYQVKAKQKCFRLWGKARQQVKTKQQAIEAALKSIENPHAKIDAFFPSVALFGRHQVIEANGSFLKWRRSA
jgi:hypothetical protein